MTCKFMKTVIQKIQHVFPNRFVGLISGLIALLISSILGVTISALHEPESRVDINLLGGICAGATAFVSAFLLRFYCIAGGVILIISLILVELIIGMMIVYFTGYAISEITLDYSLRNFVWDWLMVQRWYLVLPWVSGIILSIWTEKYRNKFGKRDRSNC
jgi:uncharacterized YccA/Bax inhibitor family protein